MKFRPPFRGAFDEPSWPRREKLPCWPRASRVTVLLTKGVYNVTVWLFLWPVFAFVLLLAFEKQVDDLLQIFGYSGDFVSSFSPVRDLQSHLASVRWINHIDIGYFHLLDVTLWVAIIVYGTWLITGVIFLRQYDDLFQLRSTMLSERFGGRSWPHYLGWILLLSVPFVVTHLATQDKILRDAEVVFFINKLTPVYFWLFSVTYYYGVAFFSATLLFFIWKIFRENWPGAILCREESRPET